MKQFFRVRSRKFGVRVRCPMDFDKNHVDGIEPFSSPDRLRGKGASTGKVFRSTASTTLNKAVFGPMPSLSFNFPLEK